MIKSKMSNTLKLYPEMCILKYVCCALVFVVHCVNLISNITGFNVSF